jgi:DNA-binding Xre family transcriptional regulator
LCDKIAYGKGVVFVVEKTIRVDVNRLNALIALRGLSTKGLAAKMDMHQNGIIKIKREQSTTFNTLEKLCEVLDCHPFDLIVAEGYPEPFLAAPVSR